MKDVYVHTLRYRQERGNRPSRTMFPLSFGQFRDQEAAWEWVRRTGITHATRLKSVPAGGNVEVLDKYFLQRRNMNLAAS